MDDPFRIQFIMHPDKPVKVFLVLLYPFFPAECLADSDHGSGFLYLRCIFIKIFAGGTEAWTFQALFPADEPALCEGHRGHAVPEMEKYRTAGFV